MDISALPYFYSFLVEGLGLFLGLVVYLKQKPRRATLGLAIVWVATVMFRHLLIVLSAGDSGIINRADVVWWFRFLVFTEATILLLTIYPFLRENTTFEGIRLSWRQIIDAWRQQVDVLVDTVLRRRKG